MFWAGTGNASAELETLFGRIKLACFARISRNCGINLGIFYGGDLIQLTGVTMVDCRAVIYINN